MRRRAGIAAALGAGCLTGSASAQQALPPRYDHVVVVILENVARDDVIGPPGGPAPYINSLAAEGTLFTGMYSLTRPSAPNYGELFAGFHNNLSNAAPPADAPLNTPNLGAELRQAGFSFAGYSQSLPEAGSTVFSAEPYGRRHNPWVNWQNDAPDALPNQLPPTTNLRFDDFPDPAHYASLPTVSFVVPDNLHNMHDGERPASVQRGDAWLRDNLDSYYQWAKAHNSLLVVTADEDSFNPSNQMLIPTVFAGAGVRAGGTVAQTYTLHNVLRTLEDAYGTAHAGQAANVRPIVGAFKNDPAVTVQKFRTGLDGYAGAVDTQIRAAVPQTSFATATTLTVEADDDATAGNQASHALIRFDGVVGAGTGQVPWDATVLSAKMTLWTTSTGAGATTTPLRVHRMLKAWGDGDTWATFGEAGVVADGVRAAARPDFVYAPPLPGYPVHLDVSDTVQGWLDGTPNYGWAILPSGDDGYEFMTSEAPEAYRPALEVSYALYPRFDAAGGSWKNAANWAHGVPDGQGAVARFLTNAAPTVVTLDGERAVGTLIFDSSHPYTLTGGDLTLANNGNTTSLLVRQGRHTILAPLRFVGPGTIDVAAGAGLVVTGNVALSTGMMLTKTGAGTADLTGGVALADGSVLRASGGVTSVDRVVGRGTIHVGAGAVVRLTGISLQTVVSGVRLGGTAGAWEGRLDLGRSGLVIDYDGASPLATVADQVRFARRGGGAGIGSSVAAADARMAVAVTEASALLGLSPGERGTFMGQEVDDTSLVVRAALAGDATLDGVVDFNDLVRLAQHYNATAGAGGWAAGDFTDDGVVDFNDLVTLAQNYNSSAAPVGAGWAEGLDADVAAAFARAPEPVEMTWLLGMRTLWGRRGRRKC